MTKPFIRLASASAMCATSTAIALSFAALTFIPDSARAADLPAVAETAVRPLGPLRTLLSWGVNALKWLVKYVPAVRGLIDALEELSRLLDDAKRAAEADRKITELSRKLSALETDLATDRSSRAASARVIIKTLRVELERRHYKSCGFAQHRRPDGTCGSKITLK